MLKNKDILKSPPGMMSYLPEVAAELKTIEGKILEVFNMWGYQPVLTPTLEYYKALQVGMGNELDNRLYKFIDYEGNILALRPEMTAPIARTLATRINDLKLPLRLSYSASVFRYDQLQTGKSREIYQLGVEFIGEKNYLADAEAIILAIESLKSTGLEDFKIDIGHADFLNGVVDELGLGEEEVFELKRLLNKKDLVGLNNLTDELKVEGKEILKELPLLRGSVEILAEVKSMVDNPRSLEALNNLKELFLLLEDYSFADYINFDLCLNRGFDYYTGVVFEGFTEKLGYNICGGGRYDNLLRKYSGSQIPAIGFAIGIERVRLALMLQKKRLHEEKFDNLIVYNKGYEKELLKLVKKLHERDLSTVIDNSGGLERAKEEGKEAVKRIIFVKNENELIVEDLEKNERRSINLKDDGEEVLWEI